MYLKRVKFLFYIYCIVDFLLLVLASTQFSPEFVGFNVGVLLIVMLLFNSILYFMLVKLKDKSRKSLIYIVLTLILKYLIDSYFSLYPLFAALIWIIILYGLVKIKKEKP